jgi:hypothetical protein
MSNINWAEIATQCGPSIGSQLRGVLKITRFGFHVLFVPGVERSRVEEELAKVNLVIHGYALWTREDGKQFFVAVVKADSTEKLREIAQSADAIA